MMEDLSRRAVACKGWRWMPGMRDARTGERYETGDGFWIVNKWPDLTDPATLGCLLALVRDAHRDAFMAAGNDGPGWVGRDCDGYEVCRGTSERAVLVAALEAAD